MNSQSSNCCIIQDLLPSYNESLTSASTNEFIENHIDKCTICKEIQESLKSDIIEKSQVNIHIKPEEINFLKKFNHKNNILKIMCGLLIISLLSLGAWKFCFEGFSVPISQIKVSNLKIENIDHEQVYFTTEAKNIFFKPRYMKTYSSVDDSKVVSISFECILKNPFSKSSTPYMLDFKELKSAYGYNEVESIYIIDNEKGQELLWSR